jgi:hypothetical protein
MFHIINALVLAVLVPAGGAQKVEDGPACRAELNGLNLLTVLELPSGLRVEAPWRVVHSGSDENGQTKFVMFATADRVVETDPVTGVRNIIPFPQPVSLAFEGASQRELVQRAAQVWCVTVMRAQENQDLQQLSPVAVRGTRVTMLPAFQDRS